MVIKLTKMLDAASGSGLLIKMVAKLFHLTSVTAYIIGP